MKRRDFLKTSSLTPLVTGALIPAISQAVDSTTDQLVVVIFQRGAADGLSLVPPHGDDQYYQLRPTLGILPPGQSDLSALDLDGFFGIHPAMPGLKSIYDNGDLAVVHAFGSYNGSHSHFDAQDLMEQGALTKASFDDGWLSRHLQNFDSQNSSVFRAVSLSRSLQVSLKGSYPASAISSISQFDIVAQSSHQELLSQSIQTQFDEPGLLGDTASLVFDAIEQLDLADPTQHEPQNNAVYSEDNELAVKLKQVVQLHRSNLGMEICCVDHNGWDHHDDLASQVQTLAAELSSAMSTMYQDLGDEMQNVTVIVMTEFGRRAYENGSAGTDHGYGSAMFAMGKGVQGGQVYGQWPGLEQADLYGAGDLEVTTDYRTVLWELLESKFPQSNPENVFSDFNYPGAVGLFTQL